MTETEGQLVENNGHKFMTISGIELELRAVNKLALQSLTLSSGVLDILAHGGDIQESFSQMTPAQQAELSNKMLGVLRFCMMYGVVNDPPADVLEELKVVGAAQTPNIARMNWIMGILADDKEAGLLVAAIRGINAG